MDCSRFESGSKTKNQSTNGNGLWPPKDICHASGEEGGYGSGNQNCRDDQSVDGSRLWAKIGGVSLHDGNRANDTGVHAESCVSISVSGRVVESFIPEEKASE